MVSVIIPNYNHAPFLQQRIDSVLNQTWQDFEIIILDDCSTDASSEIIESYRNHPRISTIVYNPSNTGVAFKQWQKGIELSKGDWIWIAESDDWCEPVFLETLLNGITNNTAIAVAQSVVVSSKGEILWQTYAAYLEKTITGNAFINDKMLLDNFGIPNASMCIFKKSLYYNIDDEFSGYQFCGDMLFWILLALQGDVFVSGKYLNYFRKHDKDVSGAAYKNGLHYFEYFKLLKTLVNRKIITSMEYQALLSGKLKMFLRDKRPDLTVMREVRNEFRLHVESNFYSTIARYTT
ncbi:MAG: glycosyltransferase, partial [Bacteroidota bacterium]|nr:glycosyltransferase [Bacteroidota bacterium]